MVKRSAVGSLVGDEQEPEETYLRVRRHLGCALKGEEILPPTPTAQAYVSASVRRDVSGGPHRQPFAPGERTNLQHLPLGGIRVLDDNLIIHAAPGFSDTPAARRRWLCG